MNDTTKQDVILLLVRIIKQKFPQFSIGIKTLNIMIRNFVVTSLGTANCRPVVFANVTIVSMRTVSRFRTTLDYTIVLL